MVGLPYNGGALRFGSTIDGETINWTDDDIYLALMDSTYVQDVAADVHWSDIVAYEIEETGDYVTGGLQLTTVEPYIESTLYAPFRYVVYTANAAAEVPYSVKMSGVTFTDITGAAVYKKGVEVDDTDSPLFTFIVPPADKRNADDDKYYVEFGNMGETLGIYNRLLGTPIP